MIGAGMPLLVEDMVTGGKRETWLSDRLDEMVDAFYAFAMLLMFTTTFSADQLFTDRGNPIPYKDYVGVIHHLISQPSPFSSPVAVTITMFMGAGFSWYLTRSLLRHITQVDRRLTLWVMALLGTVAALTVSVPHVVAGSYSKGAVDEAPWYMLFSVVPAWLFATCQYRAWRHAWRSPDLLTPEARTPGFRQAVRLLRWYSWMCMWGLLSVIWFLLPTSFTEAFPLVLEVPIYFIAVAGTLIGAQFAVIVLWWPARRLVQRGTPANTPPVDADEVSAA